MNIKTLKYIQFLFWVHLTALLFFTFFRIILLWTQYDQLQGLPDKYSLLFRAMLMGLRFDNVIACYLVLIPLFVLSVASIFKIEKAFLNKSVLIFMTVIYPMAFFICAADIPYFNQFFKRLNSSVFNWLDSWDFVVKMILQEKRYVMFLLGYIALMIVFILLVRKIWKKYLKQSVKHGFQLRPSVHLPTHIGLSVLLLSVCIMGIRGRMAKKSPIRVGTAFFSNYTFPNQLGLNPVFTLMRSILDDQKPENKALHLMDDEQALGNTINYLGIHDPLRQFSPIGREIIPDTVPLRINVVVVIMEGLSSGYMQTHGNPKRLTPFLDSLASQSWYFENIYTSGIHTMNGIYSTLFSYPTLLKQHPLNPVDIRQYQGFASTLAEKGYQTIYFTTHDDQFDNVGGFLKANGFQQIISQKDYPNDKIMSTLGVVDDYMFEFSIARLNQMYQKKKPFFAAFLTASNHDPIIFPEYFTSHFTQTQDKMVEYSDWALQKFFRLCRKQAWFDQTLFVFISDHGAIVGDHLHEMPLPYQHSPLIMYSRPYLNSRRFSQLGGQIDVFPTVMGILQERYVNTTLGVDLIREGRPCIYFTADDKIGCLNHEYYYVYHIDGREILYDLRKGNMDNFSDLYPAITSELKNYAFSMLQTTQWLLKH